MYVVYTKPNCVWCDRAKALLDDWSLPYSVLKIGEDVTKDWLLAEYPGIKTAPVVVHNGDLIGGYEQLKSFLRVK